MPKRIDLKYKVMHMRSMVAIFDHNHNINKKELGDKMIYSKPAGRYMSPNTNLVTTSGIIQLCQK